MIIYWAILKWINNRILTIQVKAYGTCTVVFAPYFTVIQAGDLRPYTVWIRLDYVHLRSTVNYHWGITITIEMHLKMTAVNRNVVLR